MRLGIDKTMNRPKDKLEYKGFNTRIEYDSKSKALIASNIINWD